MKLCNSCHTYEALPIPDKSQPSEMVITKKEMGSTGFTFLFPTTEGELCYYCSQKSKGIYNLSNSFFRRNNLINHHNDGNGTYR